MSELEVYKRQGWGNRIGFGRSPALLIIDFVNSFADPDQFGGGNINAAIDQTAILLTHARKAGIPIAYTRIVYAVDGSDAGIFCRKAPSLRSLTENALGSQVVPQLAPQPGELIIRKNQASAFFETNLRSWLTLHCVDTLLVTGATTSGCVRATVVDAAANNYRSVVVRDCVGDRAIDPHNANLFDMEQKYADVLNLKDVVDYLSTDPATRWTLL
ncbi:isochorismatase family protein [Tardiphaga sp. 866_E4_N2_1]|uniref:isochorismatase family protein n=1 Tax=unclassified Tardiphaga TaxID=2631404 RepID=UPI003F28CCF6